MERPKIYRLTKWLALAALLLAQSAGASATKPSPSRRPRQQARNAAKLSPDFKESLRKSRDGEKVTVVVEPRGEWGDEQQGDLDSRGGRLKQKHEHLKTRVVEMRAEDVEALASRDDIEYVSPDRETYALGHVSLTTGTDAARTMDTSTFTNNRALVSIAVLDSGVDTWHKATYRPDGSTSRVSGNMMFTGETNTKPDGYGHGTHVASAAAGSALVAGGAYKGVANDVNIVNVKVLDAQGRGTVSGLLRGIDWVIANRTLYSIRVVNLSLGLPALDSYQNDPVCKAVRRMVDLGIVVVAAAGNDGKDSAGNKIYGQIHSPGIEPSAITVGASNTFGTDSRADDVVTTYSSRGPTRGYWLDASGVRHYDNLLKPDLVAPGNKVVWAAAADNALMTANAQLNAGVSTDKTRNMMYLNGTSMAAPLVAGAAALVLRHNPRLTPNMVKMILQYTAQPLAGFNQFEQGAGQLNVEGAVRLARLVRTDLPQFWNPSVLKVTMPLGSTLLKSGTTPPTPRTTIAGHTFTWAQGIVLDHMVAWSPELITKYQKIYGTGVLMNDATLLGGSGALLADLTVFTSGVLIADSVLTSSGVTISEGFPFLPSGTLMSDGVLLNDGTLMSDGVVMGDGTLMSDGVVMGDLRNDFSAHAQAAVLNGDATASMTVVSETTTAPSGPTPSPSPTPTSPGKKK